MGTGVAMLVLIAASVAFLLVFLRACLLDSTADGPSRALLVQTKNDERSAREQMALVKHSASRAPRYVHLSARTGPVCRVKSTRRNG